MLDCQGSKVDFGGYYWPDLAKLDVAMRPSAKFNGILAQL
jgi:isocitrate dehydrogenase